MRKKTMLGICDYLKDILLLFCEGFSMFRADLNRPWDILPEMFSKPKT